MHVEGVLANNDYILNGCYIEITSNCNLRCIHCYNESGELRDQISVEAFKNVLGCYDNPKKASITLSGGEPLLHPQVWKFIDMMLESGILARNILLITNATCITDDVANMLAEKHVSVQVSLNGSRAELHDSICGKGNFERTMAGLQRLLSKHANMVIVRNMMNKQNMNDNWDMFCEKLIDMGVHKTAALTSCWSICLTGWGASKARPPLCWNGLSSMASRCGASTRASSGSRATAIS